MLGTIKQGDSGILVVAAKLLTGYLKITKKVSDPNGYISKNSAFDAEFEAYVASWQEKRGLTADGIVGPSTWSEIANTLPTCSTSKNTTSGYTLALQMLLDSNLTCDGVYGSRTKAAVVVLQDAHGLTKDGICGPKTWKALITNDTPVAPDKPVAPTGFVQPVDYKQGDSRWGKKMYSNHNDKSQTMANSGCGPTACADVVATLKDSAVTPWTLAQLAMEWGDRTRNSGTAWTFFQHVADKYKFVKFVQSSSWSALTACLDAGGYVVASMGSGYWTSQGHFICVWKYDGTYVYANDPASSTRKKQKISAFKSERKQYFCFYPDAEEPEKEPVDTPVDTQIKRGSKICDISKYQPTVNYDKFIADTALIILRAGYRGTGGGINEDQKFTLHASELKKRGVRFGVYFYSIATSESKAREEAKAFYQYAKAYSPLCWAMDAEQDSITKAAIVAFVDELRKQGAGKVGCYVANHLYTKYDYASIQGKMDFTWIPRYGSTKPAYKCDLWQYTSTGSVSGISGNVDLNKITGDGHTLSWFTDDTENEPSGGDVPVNQSVIVTGNSVNVRSAPDTTARVLGIVYMGDLLEYQGADLNGWHLVAYKNQNAWISGKYSRLE